MVTISDEFALPVAVAIGMNIQCAFFGFRVVGMRKKIFNKEFMEK
jgi:hypothetical protein